MDLLWLLWRPIDVSTWWTAFDSFDDPLTSPRDGPSLTPLATHWCFHMMDLFWLLWRPIDVSTWWTFFDFSVSSHILIEFVSFHWICWTRTFWFLTWRRDGSVDPSACISFCSDWHRRLFSATDSRRLHSSTSSSHAFLVCWAWASVSSHMPIDFAGFFFDWICLLGLGPFWLLTWWGGGFFLLLFWWLGPSDVLHLWSFTCQSVLWKTDPRSTPLMIYFSSSSCAALVLFYAFCSPVFCLG